MTQTIIEELIIEKSPTETPLQESPDDAVDLTRLPKRAPPSKGLCLRCGENKPINRLMLCYPCWVKTRLEKDGWKEGEPHPEHCGCEGLKGHPNRRSEGN
ncbi:MAG: hypothetical protein AAB036_11855 [Elusimicrobiota bacterium]